jgi:hypothetical protein
VSTDTCCRVKESENDTLRAYLAYGSDPCIYCGLDKGDMAKCQSGFPGCARADDMTAADNPWANDDPK